MFTAKMVSVLVLAVTLAGCNDRLRRAAADGDVKAVRNLVDSGADASQRTQGLIAAAQHGHEEVLRMLITARSAGEPIPGLALTRASASGHAAVVRVLLESGADVNHQDSIGRTALYRASSRGHLDVVLSLLEHGADHSLQSRQGESPLLAASAEGHAEIVQTLLESGADVNYQKRTGQTALYVASAGGHVETVRLLLAHGADHSLQSLQGESPLLAASAEGHAEIVQTLLESGAEVNYQKRTGQTALYVASAGGHVETVRLLLAHGANHSLQSLQGQTPLLAASAEGHAEIVQTLLENGADVNYQYGDDTTALLLASERGHEHVVEVLVQYGGDASLLEWKEMFVLSEDAYVDVVNGFRIYYPYTWSIEEYDDGVLLSCPNNEFEHCDIHITVRGSESDKIGDLMDVLEREFSNYLGMNGWDRELTIFNGNAAIKSHNRRKGSEGYWEFEVIDYLADGKWYSLTASYDGSLADVFLQRVAPPPRVIERSLATFEPMD